MFTEHKLYSKYCTRLEDKGRKTSPHPNSIRYRLCPQVVYNIIVGDERWVYGCMDGWVSGRVCEGVGG